MVIGLLALTFAGIFAGAALYINIAEHPARMRLPTDMALAQWRPSYDRGYAMQASLAVAAGAAALWQWSVARDAAWLIGGILMLANWPYTLLVIMPTNKLLKAEQAVAGVDTAGLLRRWNRLHALRTALSLSAVVSLLFGATGQIS